VNNTYNYFADDLLVHNYSFYVFSCFPAGTKITLANGTYKNIENVVIGEEVLTYNEKTQVYEAGIVGDLKVHEVDTLIDLSFGDINLTTTPEHPFFVKGKGWVTADHLNVNDICLTDDNKDSVIAHIKKYKNKCKVYNLLSVSENHNFFANKILVHNK
jgi:intein/homing endonuclease